MGKLGLQHVARSRVTRVSSGERWRVSINVDLVHDPVVLLLDKPTSGLDSSSSLHIVKMLRDMAATQGKTVMLIIHQPNFHILELLDHVVLLVTAPSSTTVPSPSSRLALTHSILAHINVLEYTMETIDNLKSDVIVTTVTATTAPTNQEDATPVPASSSVRRVAYTNSSAAKVRILAVRFMKTVLRTPQLFAAWMVQSVEKDTNQFVQRTT